ncbi:PilN domain-containing protein [Patescibacteria group bacterium]|nr:PilN domain-containing protein [Patescibacteria group bacterium]MBU2220113.1 PilN domain-containing protein [Patescibacteria group bacterium]MBU2264755.1 PilN domain-containing protein [Patescibacteria group bacterium]
MIKLNLLPPDEKEQLNLDRLRRWVVFYGSGLLCSLSVFIFLLIVIWFSLFIQLKSLGESLDIAQRSQQGQDLKAHQDLIKELNVKIEKLGQSEKDRQNYSLIFLALAKIMPAGTRIERLSLDEKNQMVIAGYAQKRENLLDLKASLEKSALFTDIESPLTNLIKQTDIAFSFTLTVKTSDLIK